MAAKKKRQGATHIATKSTIPSPPLDGEQLRKHFLILLILVQNCFSLYSLVLVVVSIRVAKKKWIKWMAYRIFEFSAHNTPCMTMYECTTHHVGGHLRYIQAIMTLGRDVTKAGGGGRGAPASPLGFSGGPRMESGPPWPEGPRWPKSHRRREKCTGIPKITSEQSWPSDQPEGSCLLPGASCE